MTNACCGLAVILCGFISLLIGHETINIPEIFSGVHGFTGKTVITVNISPQSLPPFWRFLGVVITGGPLGGPSTCSMDLVHTGGSWTRIHVLCFPDIYTISLQSGLRLNISPAHYSFVESLVSPFQIRAYSITNQLFPCTLS